MKVMTPYILIENCHMDVVRAGLKFHGLSPDDVVEPIEEYELPSPQDFGLESFDDYVPHEDDEEFDDENEEEESKQVDIKLNYTILMKSQDQIFIRFDEQIKFDTALALVRDFSYHAAIYRSGKVTVSLKIEAGDLVPEVIQDSLAAVCFSDDELKAIREDPSGAYNFFPVVQLENRTRYAAQDYPPMVARISPDGSLPSTHQLDRFPVVESGLLKSYYCIDPYVLAELKS